MKKVLLILITSTLFTNGYDIYIHKGNCKYCEQQRFN